MNAVLYLRVSTGDQALGLEAQRAMIGAYLAREGRKAASEHVDDGVSGGAPLDKRCGLLAAIAALKRGDVLVVAKRDRLARDPLVAMMAERLAEKRGACVRCADGNGNGDGAADVLMRRMLDAFAEFERAQIAMRTRAALAELRRQGRRISGKPPFGYRFEEGRLIPAPGESAILERAQQMRACGMSVGSIVGRLGENPRTGRPWGRVSLWRALRRNAP
jgi:DNA invertase Pin-like site-specific DNA recombinase